MKFMFKDKEYYIDGLLARQLDNLVYNTKRDMDFVIIISGDRTVRVGKSVLGMTIGAYLCTHMQKAKLQTDYTLKDLYWDSQTMMDSVIQKGKFSINHYDEGREGLAANKAMQKLQQDLMDFFAECGQLNSIFIICVPDFFELKESIAVPRSEILLNVYRTGVKTEVNLYGDGPRNLIRFDRGRFEFFSRKTKQKLYDKYQTTRKKDYHGYEPDFIGRFTDQYPLDRNQYEVLKLEALKRFKIQKSEPTGLTSSQQRLLDYCEQLAEEGSLRKIAKDADVRGSRTYVALEEYIRKARNKANTRTAILIEPKPEPNDVFSLPKQAPVFHEAQTTNNIIERTDEASTIKTQTPTS